MNDSQSQAGRDRLSVLGALTGAVTHELNNIFGILGLRLEKLCIELEGDAATERDLEVIQRNVDRAAQLVGRLQELRSAAERSVVPAAAALDPAQTLAPIVATFAALYDRKLPLDVHFEDGLQAVFVPEDLVLFFVNAVQWLRRVIAPGSGLTVRLAKADGVRLEFSGSLAESDAAGELGETLHALLEAVAARPDNGLGDCEIRQAEGAITVSLRLG